MKKIIIDYLSLTFPLDLEGDENERIKSEIYVEAFKKFFKLDDCDIEESPYSYNNYRYQYILSDFITLRLAGPTNDLGFRTCQLELKGEGCREFERTRPDITWYDLFIFLLSFNPTFKRIDVTIDDLSGNEITISDVFNKINNGYYTSVFRTDPKYHGILDTGLTIDLGSRKSMIELCIYDKYKEQLSQNKESETPYWCRYEMRFRQDKANSVILDLIQNYKNETIPVYGIDLQSFATQSLYSILDIKVDNNLDHRHQNMNPTDPKWLSFLDNTKKGILPKANTRLSNTETRFNYIMPKAKLILLQWLMESSFNIDIFIDRLLLEELTLLKETTKSQLNRFNQYLKEKNKPKLTFVEFNELISKIDEILEERSLPF